VFRQGVRDNVWLFEREWDGSIFNEILDFVFETEAIIGTMSGYLVVGTEGVWVMVGRELFR